MENTLPQDLVKSRSCEIRISTFPIALKFGRHLNSSIVAMHVKFQGDTIFIRSNPTA